MIVLTRCNLFRLCMLAALSVGLGRGQEKPLPKAPEAPLPPPSGAELYSQHCVVCHGDDLKGGGPFPPPYRRPPDLTSLSRRHAGKFPEAYVSKVLRNGVKLPAHGPAEITMAERTPASTHSPTTAGTVGAGVTIIAKSTTSGTLPMLA
jgi:hypothetical protein